MHYKCLIVDVTPLRLPKVYRVKSQCDSVEAEIEFHEDILKRPNVGSTIEVEISSDRGICQQHYFCAHGYVVSNSQIGETHRVVISLHGFLVILRSKQRVELNVMDHIYLGATIK